ncbi:unnamed protein product [Malus baccata var. baccata]
MKRAFLEKFFPTSRVILLRKRISGIQQNQGESFPTYYERFKTLIASYPQPQMNEELLLQYFYEGFLPIERQMLDALAGGALVDKTPMAAKTLIANRALNSQQYEGVGQKDNPHEEQVNEVSAISELQNQMANLTTLLSQVVEKPKDQSVGTCGVCSMNEHLTDKCPQLIENRGWEFANAMGFGSQNQPHNDLFSNTYNPGWRDHPNFKWREPQQTQQQSVFRQQPPRFYQRPYAAAQPQTQPVQNNSGLSFDNAQVIQLLTTLAKGQENQAKDMHNYAKKCKIKLERCESKGRLQICQSHHLAKWKEVGSDPSPSKSNQKNDKKKQSEEKEQGMPSARIEQSLPQPSTHPNSTTKGNTRFESAMLDLGASINVMPYSIYASMNLGELKNDGVIIQLADRSNAYPKGVLEDVLVEVIDFNISDAMRYPHDGHSCFSIDVIDSWAQEFLDDLSEDALEKTLTQSVGLTNKGLTLRHAHDNNKEHLAVPI